MAYLDALHPSLMNFSVQIKRKLSNDPRYDAVGSSSLREELFNTYIKALKTSTVEELTKSGSPVPSTSKAPDEGQEEKDEVTLRKERKERAVKEREEKVRQERNKLEAAIDKSKTGLNREEDEQAFRCATYMVPSNSYTWRSVFIIIIHVRTMLTDAVRDPKVWMIFCVMQMLTN
jgi:transcription elongation regulator 1